MAVTWTEKTSPAAAGVVVMLRTTEANPPEFRVTLEALSTAMIGEEKLPLPGPNVYSATVPLKPLRLVNWIVDWAEPPD